MKLAPRVTGLAATPVALLMAFGFLAAPAQAEVWYATSGNNPNSLAGDFRRVQVDHGARTVAS